MDITNSTIVEAFTPNNGWQLINKPISEDLLIDLLKDGVELINLESQTTQACMGDYDIDEAFTLLHKTNYERGESFARLGDVSV